MKKDANFLAGQSVPNAHQIDPGVVRADAVQEVSRKLVQFSPNGSFLDDTLIDS